MWKTILGAVLAAALLQMGSPARAALSAEEKQLFTVTGVEVDVTAADAAKARDKAISEAQVKAFYSLAQKLAGEGGAAVMANLPPEEVGRLMASLSVEHERTGPKRYIGKLTISFLPEKVRAAFAAKGVTITAPLAPGAPPPPGGPILLIPVWQAFDEPEVIWDQNPWRAAISGLNLGSGPVPFRLALGDTEDWSAFSTLEEANPQSVTPVLTRYQASAAMLLVARRTETALSVSLTAIPPVTGLTFQKDFPPADESLAQAAAEAQAAISAALATAPAPQPPGAPKDAVEATVTFTSPEQWAQLRKTLLETSGMRGVDLVQVVPGGARVKLTYAGSLQDLQMALSSQGLNLLELSSGWAVQPR